jgi:hypothetical protein
VTRLDCVRISPEERPADFDENGQQTTSRYADTDTNSNQRTGKRQPENRNYAFNYALNNPRELCVAVER